MDGILKFAGTLAGIGIFAYTAVNTAKTLRDDFGVTFKKAQTEDGAAAEAK